MPNTVRLHRVLATKPDKVYRAFIEADAMAKWLPPNGFACTVHHLDAKVGGTYRMSFRNFTTGMSHSFGGKYLELVPGERLRYSDKFEDPNLPGEIQVTVALKQVSVGTELTIVQEPGIRSPGRKEKQCPNSRISHARVQERPRMARRQHRALGAVGSVIPQHSTQQRLSNPTPPVRRVDMHVRAPPVLTHHAADYCRPPIRNNS